MKGSVSIEEPIRRKMIQIGYGDVAIFDKKRSKSIWDVSGRIIFEGTAEIGHGSKLSIGGDLKLGANFIVTAESSIVCWKSIDIGSNCLISWDVLIMDTDFHKVKNELGEVVNPPMKINIGNNVWIGCRVLVLKGATITDNCIIGANAVVKGSLEDGNTLYAGSPLKAVKKNISWEV
jgi:acetyltransferase-like isoleucine patch superfamily enzyme